MGASPGENKIRDELLALLRNREIAGVAIDAGPMSSYRLITMTANRRPADPCCPPAHEQVDMRPIEGAEADEDLANLSKALGHPARVAILRLLERTNACICGDIVDELPLAQSTVSQHLKVIKEAGLIRGEIDGPRISYCIEPRTLRRLKALVGGL
jgi:ArsR family transcriptional regulator